MFDVRFSRKSIAGALALTVFLGACSGDDPVGPGSGSLDRNQVMQAQSQLQGALEVPVIYSLIGTPTADASFAPATALRAVDASIAVKSSGAFRIDGAQFNRAVRGILASPTFAAGPDERSDWYVDPELWGNTYVKDAQTGMLEVDASRNDAPARGVRITLYQRTATGNFTNTAVGTLDLIDSSTTAQMIGHVVLRDLANNVVGTFKATSSETGTTTLTISETFTGTFGVAPKTFTVADTISGTTSADGSNSNLRWHTVSKAPFANVEYDLLATGYDRDEESAGQVTMKVTVAGHTTRVEGAAALGGSGTVNVYIDDDLVAKINYDADDDETITGPNGGQVSQQVTQYLAASYGVMGLMPNPMLLHLTIKFMFFMI